MNRLLALSLTTITLLPAVALAEGPARAESVRTETFDDELVPGDLLRPGGDRVLGHGRRGHRTLIRAREHFVPEMMASVEDL